MGCGWGQSVNNLQAGDRTGMDGNSWWASIRAFCRKLVQLFHLSHAARVASNRITNSEPVASSGVCRVEKNASQRFLAFVTSLPLRLRWPGDASILQTLECCCFCRAPHIYAGPRNPKYWPSIGAPAFQVLEQRCAIAEHDSVIELSHLASEKPVVPECFGVQFLDRFLWIHAG